MEDNNSVQKHDELSTGAKAGWFLLCFCIPIAGLVLWLVLSDDEPEKSRCCRNGFIANIIFSVAVSLFALTIFGIFFASLAACLPG